MSVQSEIIVSNVDKGASRRRDRLQPFSEQNEQVTSASGYVAPKLQ